MKLKNCYSCKHLEWGSGDVGDSEGYVCNKRAYRNAKDEDRHLAQLCNEDYRNSPKKCCEQNES